MKHRHSVSKPLKKVLCPICKNEMSTTTLPKHLRSHGVAAIQSPLNFIKSSNSDSTLRYLYNASREAKRIQIKPETLAKFEEFEKKLNAIKRNHPGYVFREDLDRAIELQQVIRLGIIKGLFKSPEKEKGKKKKAKKIWFQPRTVSGGLPGLGKRN